MPRFSEYVELQKKHIAQIALFEACRDAANAAEKKAREAEQSAQEISWQISAMFHEICKAQQRGENIYDEKEKIPLAF
jgi:hypothetical protein